MNSLFRSTAIAVSLLALGACPMSESDPRAGYVTMQPLLIAQLIDADQRFIKETDRSLNSVELIDGLGNVAHIRGYYLTALSRPGERLNYQMVVLHDASRNMYASTCFVLRQEMAEDGKPGCF